jgi:hypothetical protein
MIMTEPLHENGKGILFPGDVIRLPFVEGGNALGTVLPEEECRKERTWQDDDWDFYIWVYVHYDDDDREDGTDGFGYSLFEGDMEQYIHTRAADTDPHPRATLITGDCCHPRVVSSWIGIGPSGYNIRVCRDCKQEV